MDALLKALEEIGEVQEYGCEYCKETHRDHFTFKIGKRNISDFVTMMKLRDIQNKYLNNYPIIHKMIMDDDVLELDLKSE